MMENGYGCKGREEQQQGGCRVDLQWQPEMPLEGWEWLLERLGGGLGGDGEGNPG